MVSNTYCFSKQRFLKNFNYLHPKITDYTISFKKHKTQIKKYNSSLKDDIFQEVSFLFRHCGMLLEKLSIVSRLAGGINQISHVIISEKALFLCTIVA